MSTVPLTPAPPHHNIPTRLSPAEEIQFAKEQQESTHPLAGVTKSPPIETIISDMVRCEDQFCPEYNGMNQLAVETLMQHRFPQIVSNFSKCMNDKGPVPECTHIFEGGVQRIFPILTGMLNHERIKVSSDPLINYKGGPYSHSFWFQGVGDIWRRVAASSRLVTPGDCQVIIRESERCFENPQKVKDGTCLRLYGDALACESGAYCTYLQLPLLSCLKRKDILQSGNYDRMKDCLFDIPNFQECRTKSIPMTPIISKRLGIEYQEDAT